VQSGVHDEICVHGGNLMHPVPRPSIVDERQNAIDAFMHGHVVDRDPQNQHAGAGRVRTSRWATRTVWGRRFIILVLSHRRRRYYRVDRSLDDTRLDHNGAQFGMPIDPERCVRSRATRSAVASTMMVAVKPRVSIGLPVYNGDRFLGEAIESVLAQTFCDFELLISDNGSTDSTSAISSRYAAQDARIRHLRQDTNQGASWNFNHVFEQSSGEFFVWLAHDDVWHPDFLRSGVDSFDADPSVVLAFSNVTLIDEQSEPIGVKEFDMRTDSVIVSQRFRDVLMAWHDCLPVFGLIRSDALRRTKLIRPYASGDHLLLGELSLRGTFAIDRETLFRSRRHAAQSIQTFSIWVDHHAYTRWFEQADRRGTNYPQWRLLRELIVMVGRGEIGLTDRLRSFGAVARWSVRYRSLLRKDLVLAWRARRQSRMSGPAE